jgi:hypothetical protein
VYVDFNTLNRYPKKSAYWFKRLLKHWWRASELTNLMLSSSCWVPTYCWCCPDGTTYQRHLCCRATSWKYIKDGTMNDSVLHFMFLAISSSS